MLPSIDTTSYTIYVYTYRQYTYMYVQGYINIALLMTHIVTVYTRILAEHKTSNLIAEIVGSAYTRITIITLLHVSKIIILILILRGRHICESANMRVYTVVFYIANIHVGLYLTCGDYRQYLHVHVLIFHVSHWPSSTVIGSPYT